MAAGPAVGGGKRGSAAQTVGVLNLLTDLAFNLLIFFVVCASVEPEKGRPQQVPGKNEDKNKQSSDTQNPKVRLTRIDLVLNDEPIAEGELLPKLKTLLGGRTETEQRFVIVSSEGDTPYSRWIKITGIIEQAGGVIMLQLEDDSKSAVKAK